jgi:methyl-accepting chemotaxis protein
LLPELDWRGAVENLVVAFVILTSLFIFIQVSVLAGVFISVRKLAYSVERLRTQLEVKIEPAVDDFKGVLTEIKEIVGSVRGASENFAAVSQTVKHQVDRVNSVIEETTDRAKVQIMRADEVVADAIERMEVTASVVQENIMDPVREVSAVIRGVSAGLRFLFAGRKNPADQVHQDEELFI